MKSTKFKSVLLVDDSYVDNLINKKIMENTNFAEQIIVIDSPAEAINYLKKCLLDQENIPDVVFLDLRMPQVNGFDFVDELKHIEGIEKSNIKIFILSSTFDPQDIKQIESNGLVSQFICKPLTNQTLLSIVS